MNRIKHALINIRQSKFTAFLNLMGLTGAFAAFIVIMLYVSNEYNFDKYNEHFNDIYRIEFKRPTKEKFSVYLFGPTGKTLVDEFPEIEVATTFMPWGKWGLGAFKWENEYGEIKDFEDYAFADKYFTDVFTFDFLQGKSESPLEEPNSAIIAQSFAKKAWGNSDPIGKQFHVYGIQFKVTAVFDDLPKNSVVTCPVILAMPNSGWIAESAKGWNVTNYPQFIKTTSGISRKDIEEKIRTQSVIADRYNAMAGQGEFTKIVARPLGDLHFTNEVSENPLFTSTNKTFVDSLFFVGILVLLVAFINFLNFSTATIPQRIKSISIKRIVGSNRSGIVSTYITETFILFVVSFALALFLSALLIQLFSASVFGYELLFAKHISQLLLCAIVCIGFSFPAGLYPGLYITSGKPIVSLNNYRPKQRINFRGILTVAQFMATIALIITSLTVIKQVKFMENTDLGFTKDNLLVVNLNDELSKNHEAFEHQLESSGLIEDYAYSRAVPGRAQEYTTYEVNGKLCPVWNWAADDNYIELMNFELIDGRYFNKDTKGDLGNFICNEAAVKQYGWQIGQKIRDGELVGVIRDFNFVSLRENIEPFVFYLSESMPKFGSITIKLNSNNIAESIAQIKQAYEASSTEIPFKYYFIDERMNALYVKEDRHLKLITGFSILSVLVSVLGILGLSVFMCRYRIKEIGVRKVNGAKIGEIVRMLNSDFVKWVILAYIMSCPVAWFIMNSWLAKFAFRTNMSWWIFALAGILALAIALLTVSWQTYRAASRNPVEALRYE